ncbi:MAG: Fn3-like domain-containing protein [Leadbetterella sp.]|nr:Fn3-like domain-containing protein [Leadbetterella sp.]
MRRLFFLTFISVSFFDLRAQQININPSIVEFHLQNIGSSETQVITITNNSSKTQSFEVSLGDWNRKVDGAHDYFKPNSMPYSCASWLTFDKNFIEIPAGKSGEITLTMQAPNNAQALESMKWAMLFVQGANLKKPITNGPNEAKASIQEIIRMGIHVYQTPPSLNEPSAKAVSLLPVKENKRLYNFEVENNGKIMITGRSHLEITNLANSQETITEAKEFPVFPGGKRIIPLEIPATIKPGKYSILAVLDYGENASLEAIEKTIEIK